MEDNGSSGRNATEFKSGNGLPKSFLRSLRLRFDDPNLEKAFQDDYYHESIRTVRISLLLAVGLYAAFGLLDSQIVPNVMYEAWIIRYAVFCPLILGIFFFSYVKNFQRYMKLSLALGGFVAGVGIITMIALANPPGSDIYYVGLLLTTLFCFIFLRLDLLTASVLAWTIFLLYVFTAVYIKGVSTFILVNNTFFFISFNFVGMVACYWIGQHMRFDFIYRRTMTEQKEKLELIFDHSPVGIMHFSADGEVTACNASLAKILGSTRGKIVGLRMLVDLKDIAVIDAIKRCLSGRMSSYEGAYVSVTANNTAFAAALFAPITGKDGKVVGGIGIVEDITEKHNAQEALQESEQRHRALHSMMRLVCDNVPDLIWAKDLQGKFTFVNRAMVQELLGAKDTDEPIGKTDMFFAERQRAERPDQTEWFTFGEICVNSDAVVLANRRAEKFDEFGNVRGEFLFLNVYKAPFLNEDGLMIGTVGCGRDVTRERQLEREKAVANQALAQSEKKFRFITESMADNVWMMDLNFRTTYVSPSIEKLLGFTPEERQQQSLEENVTPDSLNTVRAVFAQEMKNELDGTHDPDRNIIIDTEYYTKSGGTLWAENNIRAIRGPDGILEGLLGLTRDISERKLNRQRLEKLNECLLRLGPDHQKNIAGLTALCGELFGATCALYTDVSERIIYSTGQWDSPPGFVFLDNLEGHVCHDVIQQDKRLLLVRNLQETVYAVTDPNVARYSLQTYMGSVVYRDGKPHGSLSVVFQRDFEPTEDEKNILQIIASAISGEEDREISWSQLRQRQAMEHLLLEISGKFINVASTAIDDAIDESLKSLGSFCEVDRTYVFLFDFTRGTMSNTHEWCAQDVSSEKHNLQNLPTSLLKEFMSKIESGKDVHIHDVSTMGAEWRAEKELLESQGIKSLVLVPMFQCDKLMGFVGFDAVKQVRNWEEWQFTLLHMYADRLSAAFDRMYSEAERSKLNAQLVWSQKMEAIGTLAGGVAHDFNNLLQVILGYSSVMLSQRQEDERDYARLKQVVKAGKRGAELVKCLLTFSRKVEPTLASINLNQEVLQFQAFLSRTIPKTIKINLLLAGDLEMALADSSQINQILMNLGVNARDAMDDGGTLTIQTMNVDLDYDFCHKHMSDRTGRYVMVSFSDTGHGMEKETLDHIFEPFFTTKDQGKGTGLGLATVYGIVEQHNGFITCDSEPSFGTTFRIYLPVAMEVSGDESQAPEVVIRPGKETILLVDDEADLRNWCVELIEGYGYTVLTAANGRQALELYREHRERISLILLDLVMPEMDGRKCLEELKKHDPNVKVVVVSGFSGTEQINMMLSLGAEDFIQKPYESSILLSRIREILDKEI